MSGGRVASRPRATSAHARFDNLGALRALRDQAPASSHIGDGLHAAAFEYDIHEAAATRHRARFEELGSVLPTPSLRWRRRYALGSRGFKTLKTACATIKG